MLTLCDSSKLYQLFDKVLVLSLGKTLYFGPGGLAPNVYFAQHGHPAQPGYNVADHLLDIASEPTDGLLELISRKSASRHSATTMPGDQSISGPQGDFKVEPDSEKNGTATPKGTPHHIKLGSSPLMTSYTTTFLTQLQVLCGREWKILKRSVGVLSRIGLYYNHITLFQRQILVLCSFAGRCRTWSFLRWALFQNWDHHCRFPRSRWMSLLPGASLFPFHEGVALIYNTRARFCPSQL